VSDRPEREDRADPGVKKSRLDFDTTRDGRKDRSRRGSHPAPGPSTRDYRGVQGDRFFTARSDLRASVTGSKVSTFRIPPGSRKAALVHLAREAWRAGLLDPKALGEVRGREVDEAGLQRALYRSSTGEIEHLLAPILKGRKVVVEGHLQGTGRSALERLGAEVEELKLEDEDHYIDMTPVVFVLAAVAMAVRYISLGLDDEALYILAGISFAVMYGLRPFFSKLQRPKDK
jgi:hypothetical protein